MAGEDSDTVELECPVCGARVETTAKAAETGKIRCPRGHEFEVMGILDAGMTPGAAGMTPSATEKPRRR